MILKIENSELDQQKLADLSVDPATQLDDHFDYSKVVVKKPWGYEYLIYQNEIVAVWILYIKPGFQTSKHCHPNKKTSLIVLSGNVECSLISQTIPRACGEGLLLEKGVFHSSLALSENGAFVMETETPNNKRDLVRLEDKYGRVGKGYESLSEMSYNIQNYNYVSLIDSKIFYNVTKKFGSCSIHLARFADAREFAKKFEQASWDAVTILRGKITSKKGGILLEPGDTLDWERLANLNPTESTEPIEIIAVKKKDSLVKLSDYVFSFLEKQGIKDIFFVPGSSIVHLLDSLARNTNLRHIRTQTESSASMASEAYAKLTNEISVCLIPSGASGTNALPGVADSWIDSTPMLILSGQARSDETASGNLRQLGIQELNIVEIVKPISKYAVMITEPNTIRYHLEKAISLAKKDRGGPVWLDLPIDIQGRIIDEEELIPFKEEKSQSEILEKDLDLKISQTLQLLESSKRPVLLVGNGVRLSGAEKKLFELMELLPIPVLTSRRGADLVPEDAPLFFGRPGAYGIRSANFILQNSDLLLSLGSRLSLPQIGRNYKAFARQAKRILIDIDPEELKKKTLSPHLTICCSTKEFIERMIAAIRKRKEPLIKSEKISDWLAKCRDWKERYSDTGIAQESQRQSVDAYLFIRTLSKILKTGDCITVDGGAPMIFVMQAFSLKSAQRILSSTGLENTSFALPAAIGCSIAQNGKEVICICEDHGFQKNIQELKTIQRYNLPIKIFVLNTGGSPYLIRETQREYFGGRFVASETDEEMEASDIVLIAQSYKIFSLRISSEKELAEKISSLFSHRGPGICEVCIDKNQKVAPKLAFTVKPDGKWISKPLEDMYPFLSREELKAQMLIDLVEEE